MSNLYPLIFILQVYCFYHAYKHKKEIFWYFIVLFLPVVGSIAYLLINIGSKVTIDDVSETIKSTVNSNYEVDKLLKESKYSDTIANKIKLADSYASKQKYNQAITLYESCLEGFNADDLKTKEKLMVAKYFTDDFGGVKELGDTLNQDHLFRNSESRIVYAWSLSYLGIHEEAEEVFKAMDVRFSNYVHRSEYAKFLNEQNRSFEAKELLKELEEEISHMDPSEQRQKRAIRKEISTLLRTTK